MRYVITGVGLWGFKQIFFLNFKSLERHFTLFLKWNCISFPMINFSLHATGGEGGLRRNAWLLSAFLFHSLSWYLCEALTTCWARCCNRTCCGAYCLMRETDKSIKPQCIIIIVMPSMYSCHEMALVINVTYFRYEWHSWL